MKDTTPNTHEKPNAGKSHLLRHRIAARVPPINRRNRPPLALAKLVRQSTNIAVQENKATKHIRPLEEATPPTHWTTFKERHNPGLNGGEDQRPRCQSAASFPDKLLPRRRFFLCISPHSVSVSD